MRRFLIWLLQLDLALWFGAGVYFSVMAAEELSGNLSLTEFGRVIDILFPPFFTLMAITAIVGWVLYAVIGRTSDVNTRSYRVGNWFAIFGLLVAVVNRVVMLPKVQSIQDAIGSFATASSAQLQQFGMWHGISLLLHFLEMAAVAVVWLCFALNLSVTGRRSNWL